MSAGDAPPPARVAISAGTVDLDSLAGVAARAERSRVRVVLQPVEVAALVEAVKAAQALAETDSLDDAALYAAQKALAVALEPSASAPSADAPLPDGEEEG